MVAAVEHPTSYSHLLTYKKLANLMLTRKNPFSSSISKSILEKFLGLSMSIGDFPD